MLHARQDYNRIQDPENKIPKDEPVILFRAQDKYALAALQGYIDAIVDDPNVTPEAAEVCNTVHAFKQKFVDWDIKKSPDL